MGNVVPTPQIPFMGDIASVLRKAASGQLCVEITLYSIHQGLFRVSVVQKSFIQMAKTRDVSGFSFLNIFLAWNNFVYIMETLSRERKSKHKMYSCSLMALSHSLESIV